MQQFTVAQLTTLYVNAHLSDDQEKATPNAFLAYPIQEDAESKEKRDEAERLRQLFQERMFFKTLKAKADQQKQKELDGIR